MIELRSVTNFRDIGGHPAADGRRVRRGVVFRSGHLADISAQDLSRLERAGIRTVVDFRTGTDVGLDGGSRLPRGARRVHLPMGDPASAPMDLRELIFAGDRELLARHLGCGQAVAIMMGAAEALVLEQRPLFGELLRQLAKPDSIPAIVHCSAGKDRTGWAASLLLLIAGVEDDAIVAHYVESDRHRADENERALGRLPAHVERDWLRPFFECRPQYARASLAAVRRRWRDVDAYVTSGLCVAPHDLATLRERLLE